MLLLAILLFASLFSLFYFAFGNNLSLEKTKIENLKELALTYGLQLSFAVIFFLFGKIVFKTILAGVVWAFLGWNIPEWVQSHITRKREQQIRKSVNNFITTAAGMYSANMLTPEVIRVMAERIPEPLASDFEEMIRRRNVSSRVSFPQMFNELAEKYNNEELRAVSAIIEAADNIGGPKSASKGLKRLGIAIRLQDKLETERKEATSEPRISALIVISILGFGLFADVTFLKEFYVDTFGDFALAATSAVFIGMIVMYRKIMID